MQSTGFLKKRRAHGDLSARENNGMIVRELKLKPTRAQEKVLSDWLWNLTGIFNWAVRKIEQDARDGVYYSKKDFQNLLAEHGKKIGLPSHAIQGTLIQAWMAWDRCFKGIAKKPHLKSVRNKLNSIPFPDPIKRTSITDNRIGLPVIGSLKYHKQDIPEGAIKQARIIRRASGWYVQLAIGAIHTFAVEETESVVGIDTGFKHLAVLSDGTKFENQRNYIKSQERLAQAQRGKRRRLTGRLHERIANQRKDHNHKVSRRIVEKHSEIYCTNDSLASQANKFGKSINDAGIGQLRRFISYKSDNHGRKFALVGSKNTTMTCSSCGALTGPTGFAGLKVRFWECGCGAKHDRDVNAARVVLKTGLGSRLVSNGGEIQCQI